MSERAQKLAADTGAAVYWQSADDVVNQIQSDIDTMARIAGMLGN